MSGYIIQLPCGEYSRHKYHPYKTEDITRAYIFPTKAGALASNAWRWTFPAVDGRLQFDKTEAKLLKVVDVITEEVET